MLQNAQNCTISKILSGKHAPEPISKCVGVTHCKPLRPAPQKVVPPFGKSCIRPWTTTKRFISRNALVESTLADS